MNIEPDIFDYLRTTALEPHDDYTSEITYKDQKIIWNRLKEQEQEIERLNNIIKEVREMLYKRDKDDYDTYTANVLCDIQSDFEEILRGEY